jgi:hypothetical protein
MGKVAASVENLRVMQWSSGEERGRPSNSGDWGAGSKELNAQDFFSY